MKKIETAGVVGLGALGTMYAHILTSAMAGSGYLSMPMPAG